MTGNRFTEIMVEVEPGESITYNRAKLISAFRAYGITDPRCVVVEIDPSGVAMVTVYERPPLDDMPAARGEDLVMDAKGFVTVGRYHNGRPMRVRLYKPGSGATRVAFFGASGSGKSRALQLVMAAEKRSGIATWLSDLKGGQSVPEARGNVDWFNTTQEGAIHQLRSAAGVMEYRKGVLGHQSHFIHSARHPLLSVRIEEANLLLKQGAPYRDEASYLITTLGNAGRSLGVGVSISGQAGRVADLGGGAALRDSLTEGAVFMLRWPASGAGMVSLIVGALLDAAEQLTPISGEKPKLRSQLTPAIGGEVDPDTAGMTYLISAESEEKVTTLGRFLRVGSTEVLEGLDPEILDLYGPGDPVTVEQGAAEGAGQAYAERWDGVPLKKGEETPGSEGHADDDAPRVISKTPVRKRVQEALSVEPMDADALLAAVNDDGGREVTSTSLRTTIRQLVTNRHVMQDEDGAYVLID
ncbi:hypothetical protein ACFPA8_27600 [Streptomyces ovatisporus]|uniref:Transfer protein n=1 Tax=Streptomyces ovatisporus TaxID=1128682 RepID=A0ABV9AH49_9ACTN